MKVESEPAVCQSNITPKLIPKSFECDSDDAFDSDVSKVENPNEELPDHLKGSEDLKSNLDDGSGFDDFNDEYNELKAFVSPLTNSSKVDLFEEDSEFYLEKSVMDCQLPELIVCYKENICNVVKDICIDEGVPSQDKLLYGSSTNEKAVCTEKVWDDEFSRGLEKRDADTFTSDGLKHLESLICQKDSNKQCDFEDLTRMPEAEYDVAYFIENDIPNLSMADLVPESSETLFVDNKNDVRLQSQQVSSETAEVPVVISVAEESDSNTKEATLPYAATTPASEEPNNNSIANDLSYNSKMDNGTITFDFNSLASIGVDGTDAVHRDEGDLNSSTPTTSCPVECQETSSTSSSLESTDKRQQQCHYSSNSKSTELYEVVETRVADNNLSAPNQFQHGFGESSFSCVGPLESLISNSGRIGGYSGSISLRSDSSTTSTRSFAFPILQSEWNSSPVRMARADRKFFRKHRGWKQSFLCCRF